METVAALSRITNNKNCKNLPKSQTVTQDSAAPPGVRSLCRSAARSNAFRLASEKKKTRRVNRADLIFEA